MKTFKTIKEIAKTIDWRETAMMTIVICFWLMTVLSVVIKDWETGILSALSVAMFTHVRAAFIENKMKMLEVVVSKLIVKGIEVNIHRVNVPEDILNSKHN